MEEHPRTFLTIIQMSEKGAVNDIHGCDTPHSKLLIEEMQLDIYAPRSCVRHLRSEGLVCHLFDESEGIPEQRSTLNPL